MREDYTPTTEEMRWVYVRANRATLSRKEYEAEFDRWLAERDAEVAAKALTDAADEFESGTVEHDHIKYASDAPLGWSDESVVDAVMSSGPTMDWLRARAAEYRKAVQS